MLICGVEEAGRGPVIGPMVMAAATIEQKDEHKLVELGAKDSKLLSPKKREDLFEQIKSLVVGYEIIILSPEMIDAALIAPELNLNLLEAITSANLISKLDPDIAYLDCPSTNIKAYRDYVSGKLLNKNVEIIAEHKADVRFPIVSAASILAKVTRDREIEKLKEKYGVDFGSGYPSDPKTVRFLAENFDKYPIFRKTWASYQRIIQKDQQSTLGRF
ncbi:ribonuclease HII [Candidatus Woesearchaeota archaeon]|nr:ribonuclease HII [Candidatus Woesearchaeota archaeon]